MYRTIASQLHVDSMDLVDEIEVEDDDEGETDGEESPEVNFGGDEF